MQTRIHAAVLLLVVESMVPETLSADPDRPAWNGKVQQWATLREVMHGTVMEGQVRLSEVIGKRHIYGIGAPDKLQGEILIADSEVWIAKIQDGNHVETRQTDGTKETAVFLAVSQVPNWSEVTLDRDVSAEEFDEFMQQTLSRAGLQELETVPFVIEGKFPSVDLHVLNGQCPFGEAKSDLEGAGPPHRASLKDARGLLVGFYSESGAGRITHHWTRTHVHALLDTEAKNRMAGHVDAVSLQSGTVVRIPDGPGNRDQQKR